MFMKTKRNTDIHNEDDICMLAALYILHDFPPVIQT